MVPARMVVFCIVPSPLHAVKNLLGDLHGIGRCGPPTVERHVRDDFADLLFRHPIIQGAPDVAAELVGAVHGDQRGDGEAARWAASCTNQQPWYFIVATKEEKAEYARLLSCLRENNQLWASQAPVLMVSVAKLTFDMNGQPNRYAFHDVGLAAANLIVQATALDLFVHQMAGFYPDKVRELYGVPDDFEQVAGIVLGYPGDLAI